jgi:hypothetical protein
LNVVQRGIIKEYESKNKSKMSKKSDALASKVNDTDEKLEEPSDGDSNNQEEN